MREVTGQIKRGFGLSSFLFYDWHGRFVWKVAAGGKCGLEEVCGWRFPGFGRPVGGKRADWDLRW
jgi:hypothetical protein